MIAQDNHLEYALKKSPLIAFKRQSNFREMMIKAKVEPERGLREKRTLNGKKKCERCVICSYIK